SHINGYQWRLEDLTDDDEYKKFDFFGNLRRRQQDVLLNFTSNPIVGNYYQGVTEYYPEEHRDILFARVEFNCSSQEENYSFCTENNLRNLARTLTTVGNAELVQTLGKIY